MAEAIPTPSSSTSNWPPASAASTSFASTLGAFTDGDGDAAATEDETDVVISRYVDLIALGELPPPGGGGPGKASLRETLMSLGWTPPSRTTTFDDVLARFSEPERDVDAGAVAKFWRRVNPSKTARRQRLHVSITAKMPSSTHHQILQLLLFQSLIGLLTRSSLLSHSFSATAHKLQRSLARWDRLNAKDVGFELESTRLSQEVDEFVDRLSVFLTPVSLDDPVPTATAGSPQPGPHGGGGGSRRMSRREAFLLERRARRLTSRSNRFHDRFEAHRAKKDEAKDLGSALIDEMKDRGGEIKGVEEELEEVVLELVILWKNGKVVAGKHEGEREGKGKGKFGPLTRTRKASFY